MTGTAFDVVPGRSLLHRLPAGVKLVSLALVVGAVTVLDSPAADAVGIGAAVVLHQSAGLGWQRLRRVVVPMLWLVVPLAVWSVWTRGWAIGLGTAGDVLAVVILGAAVTATTSPGALLDTLAAPMHGLARVPVIGRHVDAERVALTFALTLAAIPALSRSVVQAREAAAARGLDRSWRAVLVPTTLRAVAHAFAVAEALAARGLDD